MKDPYLRTTGSEKANVVADVGATVVEQLVKPVGGDINNKKPNKPVEASSPNEIPDASTSGPKYKQKNKQMGGSSSNFKQDKSEDKDSSDSKEIAGIKLSEITKTDEYSDTANPLVKILVAIGIALVIIGLFTAFFSFMPGFILIVIGAIPIVVAVFGPLHGKSKKHSPKNNQTSTAN